MYSFGSRLTQIGGLLIFVFALLFSAAVPAQQNTADKTIQSIERNKKDNTPTSITFSQVANWKPAQAQEIFSKYLGIQDGDHRMVAAKSTTTKMNVTTDRYVQYYKGIKVEYGSYAVVHKEGLVHFVTGNYYNIDNATSSVAAIDEHTAFDKATGFVGAVKYKWQDPACEAFIKARYHKNDTSYLPHGILTWIEDYNGGGNDRKLHLAYLFDIFAQEPLSHQQVFIDAATGKVLFSNSLIKHTAASGHTLYSGVVPFVTAHIATTYRLYDSTRGNGVHTMNLNHGTNTATATEFTTTTNLWPNSAADSTALDAHWGGEMVYDYWRTQQGRLSWDDLDGTLTQYVHYSNSYDNAFWDGEEMNYGDGSGCGGGGFTSLTSLDVTAHEIGHGVCQATANLVYAGESGGMNEAFSDCWGATIENWANPHETDLVTKQPWKIGEEIGCGNPLRSMDNPKLQGQPDTYLGTNWVTVVGCTPGGGNDQCGVHTNSGILNHWYYLVTMGGIGTNDLGNGYNVNAIGWTEAANILYQTELVLASDATYPDCRTASINVATTLYGACSAEVQSVTNAWYAVGVGTAFVPCVPQLGFTNTVLHVTELAATTTCPASTVITIGVKPFGPAIAGGNPTINFVVAPGATAVAGVDYVLTTPSLTWTAGDVSTHFASMTIYDNGAINDNKQLRLAFTLTAAGSNATISPTNDTLQLFIDNNDSIPLTGGPEYHTLNTGAAVTSNLTSAFYGSNRRARTQYILPVADLVAAGVRPGAPITQIAFNITTKNSTAPFIGYTVSMGNTTAVDVSTAFVTTFTQVYTGNHTTNLGLDSLDFNTGTFTWDGTSNVVVQVCFGMNAAAFSANDQMSGIQEGPLVCDHNSSNTGTGTGCSLTYSTGGQSNARPVMRFKQTVAPSKIATVAGSARTWDVRAGQEVYFYNPADTNLVAGLKNITNNLGCVNATVTQQGVGFSAAVFAPINRSKKEISITPTINGATTSYDATIYLTNTELAGVAASTLFLVKTDAPTDATVSTANSMELTPTLITGTNYVGFKGSFTGFSRFFLVDGPLCNPPSTTVTPSGPTTFCTGGSVTLNVTTGAGLTYQWQDAAGNIPGATNSGYTASTAGDYTVFVSQGTCNATSTPVTVIVNSVSAAPITGPSAVCTGQSITLADATTGGVWSSGAAGIATVGTAGNVTGVSAGVVVISYSVTNACGTATATTNVTVSAPSIVAPVLGTLSMCAGANTTLSDATASGTWSTSNIAVAGVNTSGVVTGVAGGTAIISYNVTNASGCISSSVVTVTVNALPSVAILPAGPITLCTGASIALNAPTGAGLTYQWQSGFTDMPGETNSSYTASLAGNYTAVITNSSGCTASSAPVVITVSGSFIVVPSVSISSSGGTVLCTSTSSITFTATPTNGGAAPAYEWFVNGVSSGTGTTYSYVPANGDVVTCVLTSNAPCAFPDTAAASLTMSVLPYLSPSVSVTASPNDTVCTGDVVTFAAHPIGGGAAPTYLWTENGINVATGPYYLYVPNDGDIIVCTMTSNYPCLLTPTAVSPPFIIHVETPSANTVAVSVSQSSIASGQVDTFTAVAPNAGSSPVYQWYVNGVPVAGATSSVYITGTLTNGAIVYCSVTSSVPCATPHTVISGGLMIMVTGLHDVNGASKFVLLPNPNKGEFTISGSLRSFSDDRVSIVITDMLGQTVYKTVAQAQNGALNEHIMLTNTLASGMYLVNITSGEDHVVFHVAIDK